MSFEMDQPSIKGLVERMTHELGAKAVVLLHENGQVLQKSGWIDDSEFPTMAALLAALIATGKSLSSLGEGQLGAPSRFACDSEAMGLYTVGVSNDIWVAVLYDQPLNPGQLRMKVRRYAELLAKLGVMRPAQAELEESPVARATNQRSAVGATNQQLFGNITDDEIDRLFENARS